MRPPSEQQAAPEIVELIADLLGSPPKAIRKREAGASNGFDVLISVPATASWWSTKARPLPDPLAPAVDRLKRSAEANQEQGLPRIVVLFLGGVGRGICEKPRAPQ